MEVGSPDARSKRSGASSSRGRVRGSSSSSHACKDFLRKFVDSEILTLTLEDWLSDVSFHDDSSFDVPFDITELRNFDYAIEGVTFQQLVRMPNAIYASTSDAVEATAHLAIEDFLHASVKSLWDTFWGRESPMPLTVSCIHSTSSKFYPAEKAILHNKLDGVCATAVLLKNSNSNPKSVVSGSGKWDQILQLALLRPNIGLNNKPSGSVLGEAIFFALRVLLSRSLSKSRSVVKNSNCIYVLLVDSQFGGVVRVEGDCKTLEFDSSNVYDCAADWVKNHAKITVSPVDRVWNKLGNANWGDVGTLQILLATFHSMVQFFGNPKYTLEDLVIEHDSRLKSRRSERELVSNNNNSDSVSNSVLNGNGMFRFQNRNYSPEIVEVKEDEFEEGFEERVYEEETLKLEIGSVIWIGDSDSQKGYRINSILSESDPPIYHSTLVDDDSSKSYLLHIGSSPSHLEPAWEDMNSWYQVQRQTKVLTLMKQRGVSSKYIPQMVLSGRVIHPGECTKPVKKHSESCGHPWCGTPVMVTSPIGETLNTIIKNGLFGVDDALKCCHDCLSAMSSAALSGVKHGDIKPENVIRVTNGSSNSYYVLIGWGRAVLEDKDRAVMNLFYSSTFALQEGKLCAASDAESLIYLLYFACGGVFPDLDSVEGALEWRENSWGKRVIQQRLGEVSPVLKAFADYVDSLCGTPYGINYEIWLRRLKKSLSDKEVS